MESFAIDKRYKFRRKLVPIIHVNLAKKLISMKAGNETVVNFTLHKYSNSRVLKKDSEFILRWLDRDFIITVDELLKVIKKENKLFYVDDEGIRALEIRESHYYKLVLPTPKPFPTIEIDGIHMHRVLGIDPWTDSKIKVRALGKRRERVLDICTGLGYTAILSKKVAKEVITIEKDENVLRLAEYNPWSHELENIPIINADASEIIYDLPTGYFDGIIHDPPRFSLAGELYSQEFYNELFRVLKEGGVLFHYTGKPYSKYRKKNLVKGIGERLNKAGFKVKYNERSQGFIGVKKTV